MTVVLPESEPDVCDKQRITDIVKCGDAKDHIVDCAHSSQCNIIEERASARDVPSDIVDGSDSQDDDGPDRSQEESDVQGNRKWVECGMIVIVSPGLRVADLNRAVENGSGSHSKAE